MRSQEPLDETRGQAAEKGTWLKSGQNQRTGLSLQAVTSRTKEQTISVHLFRLATSEAYLRSTGASAFAQAPGKVH